MAQAFGSPTGPLYNLGLLTATLGAPIALTANVSGSTAFGTVASPAPIVANQIIISAPSTNTGDVQLVFKTQAASAGSGVSVILSVAKGTMMKLDSPQLSNVFQIDRMGIDGATGDKAYVTLVIV